MRQVHHLKNVTQCAVLEEGGIFLVLANKVGRLIDAPEESEEDLLTLIGITNAFQTTY